MFNANQQDYNQVFGTFGDPVYPRDQYTTPWTPPPVTFGPVKVDGPMAVISDEQLKKISEATQAKTANTAVRDDAEKTQWHLMPWEAVEEINKVLEFGAKKYAAHNWQRGDGFSYTRVLNSLLRHVFAYMRGEDLDPESGLSHLAHAGCNVLFLLYYSKYKDRYKNDDRAQP